MITTAHQRFSWRLTAAAAVASILAACSLSSGGADEEAEDTGPSTPPIRQDRVDWLTANTIPITLDAAAAPADELDPIIERLRPARLVGLGEATHGTEEFNDIRFRLLRRMVETGPTRYILLEEEAGSAETLNQYLRTGNGTLAEASGELLVYYQTESYIELYRWIRQWNDEHPDDLVEIFGADAQRASDPLTSLQQFWPELADAVAPVSSAVAALEELSGTGLPQEIFTSNDAAIAEYERRGWNEETLPALEAERKAAVQVTLASLQASADDTGDFHAQYLAQTVARSLQSSNVLLTFYLWTGQFAEVNAIIADPQSGFSDRDTILADNSLSVVDHYGAASTGVYLAHNAHATVGSTPAGGAASGSLLRDALGEDYQAVLTMFDSGEFGAGEIGRDNRSGALYTTFVVDPLPRGTLSAKLALTDRPAAWLWLNDLDRNNPEHIWLFDPFTTYDIPGSYSADDVMKEVVDDQRTIVLPEAADAILFVRETTAAPLSLEEPQG